MQRRKFIQNTIALVLASHPFVYALSNQHLFTHIHNSEFNGLKEPVFTYNNWSFYSKNNQPADGKLLFIPSK